MRRRGRVCALQILYQLDLTESAGAGGRWQGKGEIEDAISEYWDSFEQVSPADREFAERLVIGVARELAAIDIAITEASRNWKVARMGRVDRNVLRVAAYEILHCPDIPRAVAINEAIEIAKSFSGGDAASFINGILDQLHAPDAAEAAHTSLTDVSAHEG